MLERLMKSHNEFKAQIKTTESHTTEKFDYIKQLMMQVD